MSLPVAMVMISVAMVMISVAMVMISVAMIIIAVTMIIIAVMPATTRDTTGWGGNDIGVQGDRAVECHGPAVRYR